MKNNPDIGYMGIMATYEILKGLPPYDPAIIIANDNHFTSVGFVVRFYKDDNTNWVANFPPGFTSLNRVIELSHEKELLVIAGGICYMMNPNSEKPIISRFGMYREVIDCPGKVFILHDDTGITVIETGKSIWHSQRISWDGIKDVQVNNNILEGLSYDPMGGENDWVPFTLDLATHVLTGGSYNKYEFKPVAKATPASRKKWWQFWK